MWAIGDALDHRLFKIAPRSGRLLATYDAPDHARSGSPPAQGAIWITDAIHDDARRGRPRRWPDRCGGSPPGEATDGVAVGAGSVWVANALDGEVVRIDPASGRDRRAHRRGHRPARGGRRAGRGLGDARCGLAVAPARAWRGADARRARTSSAACGEERPAPRSGSASWSTAPASPPRRTTGRSPPRSCRSCSAAGELAGKGPAGRRATARAVAGRRVELVEGCSESGVYGRMISADAPARRGRPRGCRRRRDFGCVGRRRPPELARRYPTVPFLVVGSVAREATVHAPCTEPLPLQPRHRAGPGRPRDLRLPDARLADGRDGRRRTRSTAGARVAAFSAEFCALGGSVERVWTPVFGSARAAAAAAPAPASTASS